MKYMENLLAYMDNVCKKDVCVAFSGGVDSSVILKSACEAAAVYGTTVYAVTFETKLHPKADLPQAIKVAEEAGAVHHIIYVNELDNEAMLNNPVNRCYLCKKYLFEHLLAYAREKGVETIMEGNNADDLLVYRPGTQAVRELGVLSPLAELGITKAQVREIAARMGLSCANRPSSPCLATRLPYGTPISFELLEKVDAGEQWMKEHGFEIVRLRLHGDILRIEIPKDKFADFTALSDAAIAKMKRLGFTYITLDMEGFRSGSMDVHIKNN
jgi:uncharacterized protein